MSTFGAPGSATSGLQGYDLEGAGKRISKQEAAYTDGPVDREPCKSCSMFRPKRACSLVEGDISPKGHCMHYDAAVGKQDRNKLAGGVILITGKGTALFLKRSRSSDHAGEWALPGGKVEDGEEIDEAIVREVREETGYDISKGSRRHIVTTTRESGHTYVTFLQRIDGDEFHPVLDHEHSDHKWASLEATPEPLHPGLKSVVPIILSEIAKPEVGKMDISLFLPINKVDVKQRLVYGTAAVEEKDHTDEIFDYLSSKPHFEDWSAKIHKSTNGKSQGNVRAMHGKVAAGKLTEIAFDDKRKAIDVCAKVVDDAEWKKVEEGVYTGFSIGGKYDKRWNDGTLKRYTAIPSEISLVDLPCMPSATFAMVKQDGEVDLQDFRKRKPKSVDNPMIIKRAEEIASGQGDKRDYARYLGEARAQLEREMAADRQVTGDVVNKLVLEIGDVDDVVINKGAAEETRGTETRTADDPPSPRSSGDGAWDQVWVSERLPGKFYKLKSELKQALTELDARESLEKAAGPLLDALKVFKVDDGIDWKDIGTKEVGKIWGSNSELPKSVKGLPDEAQTVFREAANGQFKRGGGDEAAMKVGWTAVKNGWNRGEDGKWTRKIVDQSGDEDWVDGFGKRDFSREARDKYAKNGVAMKDGSYPIPDKDALRRAVQAYGRSKNKVATKRHIMRRAGALGASDMLPEDWGSGKTKKLAYAALGKLEGAEFNKAVSLYSVADLLHCLATVQSLEEMAEIESGGYGVDVPKAMQERFGKTLVEFGDLISDLLDVVMGSMREEEAAEAAGKSQLIVDLLKAGARHSKATQALIKQVHDCTVALDESVCKASPISGVTGTGTGAGGGRGKEDAKAAKPGADVGHDHPGVINTSGIGNIAPYKGKSSADLLKLLNDGDLADEEVSKVKILYFAKLAEENRELSEKLADMQATQTAERNATTKLLADIASDVAAIKNAPVHAPGPFRVVSKGEEHLLHRGAGDGAKQPVVDDADLRRLAELSYMERNWFVSGD